MSYFWSGSAVPALERPLVVISDTHVGSDSPEGVVRDLARLIDANPGAEIVLAGDVFDLSFAPKYERSAELLQALLGRTPELGTALHRHVSGGAPVTVLPGNHDAALGERPIAELFRSRLDVVADAPVHISPWFVRRGDVHVEHGHVYDPDNAPVHPLAEWSDRTEPLGIALTRRFVAPTGAGVFSHAEDSTPVSSLARAFRVYGARAPGMIARYFQTALALCAESGPALSAHAARERSIGEGQLGDFARSVELPHDAVSTLVSLAPPPTHLRRQDVFLRLYFDRVLATLLLAASTAAIPVRPAASLISLASLAYLTGSILRRGKDPYGALPRQRLEDGAARIRDLTDARLVVLGHTHHSVVADGYLNTGSFAFPRGAGRPYVAVDEQGRAELRRLCAP
jgi:UDP-2,3-diacylglucosamine pyrophosphatase LpxH